MATLEPGASLTAIARDAGIHPGQLYGWRRQARAQAATGFVPVQIASGRGSTAMAVGGAIEIEFASGARMRVTGAVDAATLAAAVAALADGRRR